MTRSLAPVVALMALVALCVCALIFLPGRRDEASPAGVEPAAAMQECEPTVVDGRKPAALPAEAAREEARDVAGAEGAPASRATDPVQSRVLWPDGRPAEGVEVRFGRAPTGARTDANGAFDLAAPAGWSLSYLRAARAWVVACTERADGALLAARAVWEGEATPLGLTLHTVPAVRGHIVDREGSALNGARVSLLPNNHADAGDAPLVALSAADGAFVLPAFDAGPHRLEATFEDYLDVQDVHLDLPRDASRVHRLTLERPARVSGRIQGVTGEAIPGARLSLVGAEDSEAALRSEVFEDGRFVVDSLRPGVFRLRAQAQGWAPVESEPLTVASGETLSGVVLTLRRGVVIEVLVRDPSGDPRVGEPVGCVHLQTREKRQGRTDEEGRFRFPGIRTGAWMVTWLPEGSLTTEAVVGERVEMIAEETIHVTLSREAGEEIGLNGVVRRGGQPFSGTLSFFPGRGSQGLLGAKFGVEVGADGAYSVPLGEPGPWVVYAEPALSMGGVAISSSLVVQVPKLAKHRLDIDLPTGVIESVVRDEAGEPVSYALLGIQRTDGVYNGLSFEFSRPTLDSGDSGAFRIEGLAPGTYTVSARASAPLEEGFEEQAGFSRAVDLDASARVADVVVRVRRLGYLSGSVVDAGGRPVPGATVWMRRDSGELAENFSRVKTDPSGRFASLPVPAGRYSVLARSVDLASAEEPSVEVVAGAHAEVRVVVQPAAALVVACRPAEGARPLEGTLIELRDAEGRALHGLADDSFEGWLVEEGWSSDRVRFLPLPAGRYRIRATSPDGRTAEAAVTLEPADTREPVERVLILR